MKTLDIEGTPIIQLDDERVVEALLRFAKSGPAKMYNPVTVTLAKQPSASDDNSIQMRLDIEFKLRPIDWINDQESSLF